MDKSVHFRINSPKVIHETIDGETVIVNLDSGNYYSLDTVGAEIWDAIGKGVPADEIIGDVSCRYNGEPEEIDRTIRQFIDELLQEALISPLEGGGDRHEHPITTEVSDGYPPFKAPTLQKYSDMQDLLLLDPIHEVDETGWPNVKAENA
jgi:hypothetical protein